ncbi:MAG TPA: GNAT family N-acetyltransferase [Acidimicrobiales bacterium]|nr:GNAT family N-acetyltransferase [Acidimicrobiales bacterium]
MKLLSAPARSTSYVVRQATAADVPAIVELYRGLSPRSTQLRFSSQMSDLELARVADVDATSGCVAVVAWVGDELAGEARYVPWEGVHELAVTVADSHQGNGLGRQLLGQLREAAAAHGVMSLRAVVQVQNTAMLRLLEQVGVSIVWPPSGGDIVVDIACDDYMAGWGVDTGRPRVLVESVGRAEHPSTKALRDAGFDVRQCTGPGRGRGQACPILALGRCRLFEEADLVAYLLPDDDEECAEIGQRHASTHPDRLVATSFEEWRLAAPALAGTLRSGARSSGDVEHLARDEPCAG